MTQFDPGLQPERTELAWRRTALALAVGSLVMLRLLPAVLDHPWWVLAGVAGLLVTAALWLTTRTRFRAVDAALARHGDRAVLPDAVPLAALSAIVLMAGLIGLGLVLAVALAPS